MKCILDNTLSVFEQHVPLLVSCMIYACIFVARNPFPEVRMWVSFISQIHGMCLSYIKPVK